MRKSVKIFGYKGIDMLPTLVLRVLFVMQVYLVADETIKSLISLDKNRPYKAWWEFTWALFWVYQISTTTYIFP